MLPIGRPIANTRMYVLDRRLQPVPIGVAGDLHRRRGVARGYLNRPELTAERFVQIRSASSPGADVQDGDLARWRADGNIEYLGATITR